MKIEFSDAEIIALSKALRFVRFQSEDYDAREFAGSPLIAEVHKRVSEAAGEYYKSKNIPFQDEWPSIESIKSYLKVIKIHIKNVNNWRELKPEHRDSFLKTLVYPYKISDETFAGWIQFGDEFHSSNG